MISLFKTLAQKAAKSALPKASTKPKSNKNAGTAMEPYNPDMARFQTLMQPPVQSGRVGWALPAAGGAGLGFGAFAAHEPVVGGSEGGKPPATQLPRGFYKDPESTTGWSYSLGREGKTAQHVKGDAPMPNSGRRKGVNKPSSPMHGYHKVITEPGEDNEFGRMRYQERMAPDAKDIYEMKYSEGSDPKTLAAAAGDKLPGMPDGENAEAVFEAMQNAPDAAVAALMPQALGMHLGRKAIDSTINDPSGAVDTAWEWSGIPGSYRALTGQAESNWDYADPLFMIPGVGWGAKAAFKGGRAGLSGLRGMF